MKICILQTDIVWNDAAANIAVAGRLMNAASEADLYLLPEMWATGFQTAPDDKTVSDGQAAAEWMQREADKRQACIGGSLVRRAGHGFTNTFLVTRPQPAAPRTYDKRHLFRPGGEGRHFVPGQNRTVFETDGVRILLQVCYDLRFPVFARNRGDYDLMVCVANWPESRQAVWETLLRARALENQCYVCGVNRVGDDPLCHYAGGSVVIDAYGRTVADAGAKEGAVTAEINPDKLRLFRQKFPVLNDADDFSLA